MQGSLSLLPEDCWFRALAPKTDDPAAWDVYNTIIEANWEDAPGFGRLEHWPISLRTMATIVLSNTFPSALYWGEELNCLYNASYARDIAVTKHPSLMAVPYRIGWGEVWNASESLRREITNALEDGITMHADNVPFFVSRGRLAQEEAYFSYSHAPIVAENGKVGGLFTTALDVSKQVIGERRNDLLREIGSITTRAINRNTYLEQLSKAFEQSVLETPLILVYVSEDWSSYVTSEEPTNHAKYSASIAVGVHSQISETVISYGNSFKQSCDNTSREWQDLWQEAVAQRKTVQVPTTLTSRICHRRAFDEPCGQVEILPFFHGSDTVLPLAVLVCGTSSRRLLDQAQAAFTESLCNLIVLGLAELKRGEEATALAEKQQRLLESNLAQRTAEVLRSEQKFARMATVSPSGIFQLDRATGQIVFANDMWYAITGLPQGSDPNQWYSHLHPDDVQTSRDAMELLLSGGGFTNVTYRWIKDEQIVYSSVSTVNDEGMVFGVLTDVSAEIKAKEFQRLRAEEAEEHKRAQENFLDFTSHELRNPLSAIVGSFSPNVPVEDRLALDAIAAELMAIDDLQTIVSCTTHMTNIIGDVLVISKLDGNHMQLSEIICKPLEEIQTVLNMFQRDMEAKQILSQLLIDESWTDAQHSWALIDCARFKQILINLLNNAIKFSRDSIRKEVILTVSLNRLSSEQKLVVSIQDYGCGISAAGQKRLFAKFAQGSPRTAVHYGGSGLGLHICRRIAHLMGGEIRCQSEEGVGSTFRFEVAYKPVAPPNSVSIVAKENEAEKPAVQKSFATNGADEAVNNLHETIRGNSVEITQPVDLIVVLIVEDNIINQQVLSKQLRTTGKYSVLIANHGLEAIDIILNAQRNGTKIDICLCDIEMPICNGIECVQRVRRMERDGTLQHHLPFVACSANTRPAQQDSMLAAGMDATLSKPFRRAQVEEKIWERLQRK